jgi:hypothetical protein
MIRQWRHRLHVILVSLLVGLCAVDTAVACRLFGRRSCGCHSPIVACSGDKLLPADEVQLPTPEASPSDAPVRSGETVPPLPADPATPAVPPVPPAPPTPPTPEAPPADATSPAAPSAVAPPVPAEPVPPTSAPAETPAALNPASALPSATESFDDLFPPATPVSPAASDPAVPALPEPPTRSPAPAPSPDEDDPFAPQAPAPAPAPAVDEDDPFAPAPAGNRTGQPAVPARPAPAADSFADPFQTSSAANSPVRQWTDDSGLFQIRGRLIAILDGKVRILKTTGRTTTVPLARLSAADREYVARLAPPSEPALPQVAAR